MVIGMFVPFSFADICWAFFFLMSMGVFLIWREESFDVLTGLGRVVLMIGLFQIAMGRIYKLVIACWEKMAVLQPRRKRKGDLSMVNCIFRKVCLLQSRYHLTLCQASQLTI